MIEITINGVSKRQKRMLDIMWNLDSEDKYFDWYYSLDEHLQKEVQLLQCLIAMAQIDNEVCDTTDAKQLLKKFAL